MPLRRLIAGGTAAMAIALPSLGLGNGAVAVSLCVVSVCYAFMLNPTSAELGNAVDRRGMSCYAAAYAVYNLAYAVGQMAASGLHRRVGEVELLAGAAVRQRRVDRLCSVSDVV
jgi:hypothetical protein